MTTQSETLSTPLMATTKAKERRSGTAYPRGGRGPKGEIDLAINVFNLETVPWFKLDRSKQDELIRKFMRYRPTGNKFFCTACGSQSGQHFDTRGGVARASACPVIRNRAHRLEPERVMSLCLSARRHPEGGKGERSDDPPKRTGSGSDDDDGRSGMESDEEDEDGNLGTGSAESALRQTLKDQAEELAKLRKELGESHSHVRRLMGLVERLTGGKPAPSAGAVGVGEQRHGDDGNPFREFPDPKAARAHAVNPKRAHVRS